jgi:DNA repair exonuclease SbcCD nuclease subunit
VKRYNRKVKSKLKGAGLIRRAFELQQKAENYWNSEMEAEYNQIQNESVVIRNDVEKTLRRLKDGRSPMVTKAAEIQRHDRTMENDVEETMRPTYLPQTHQKMDEKSRSNECI